MLNDATNIRPRLSGCFLEVIHLVHRLKVNKSSEATRAAQSTGIHDRVFCPLAIKVMVVVRRYLHPGGSARLEHLGIP